MTGKDLERLLASHSAVSAAHLDHLGRALRAAGLMPLGGRGITAPRLDATAAANMLIAFGCGDAPLTAAGKVAPYRAAAASWSGIYSADWKRPEPRDFAGCATFGEAVETLLSPAVHGMDVRAVQFVHEWPRAEITMKSGESFFYGPASRGEAEAAGFRALPITQRSVIPVSILSAVALELAEKDEPRARIVEWE
jgi:hypothetical protein